MTEDIDAPVLLEVPLPESQPVQEELPPAAPRENDTDFYVPAPIAKVDPTGRPSHVTFIVPEYLEKGMLPKALEQFELLITAAMEFKLPCRVQKWRSKYPKNDGVTENKGESSEDPNAKIRNAANGWLICWEALQEGRLDPATEERAREHRKELVYWSKELAGLIPALLAYEVELAKFVASAPERIVY